MSCVELVGKRIKRAINFCPINNMANRIIEPLSVITFLLICNYFYTGFASTINTVHFLKPGDVVENDKSGLQIFCHSANLKYLMHMWRSLTMHLNINIDNYDLYNGKTPEEVRKKHDDNQRSWSLNIFNAKKDKNLKINPFEDVCIGVHVYPLNLPKYKISLTQTRVDISELTLMLLGAVIYWNARKLNGNSLFYYLICITLGITTSIIILVYFFSKFLLRGKMMYFVVATGWTMSFYLIQMLWDNIQLIVVQYREWVAWYILLTSCISFIISYRFGPITNVRTKKLIEWSLQIGGLITMYYSSYFREASAFCCILLILLYNFPIVIIQKGRRFWKYMFPERRKLLTEDEYRKEGIRETKKAITELKEYCGSPNCNPWKTVLKLNDPIRFAKFMEGESHLSDDELQEHDNEIIEECEYTDDEDDL